MPKPNDSYVLQPVDTKGKEVTFSVMLLDDLELAPGVRVYALFKTTALDERAIGTAASRAS